METNKKKIQIIGKTNVDGLTKEKKKRIRVTAQSKKLDHNREIVLIDNLVDEMIGDQRLEHITFRNGALFVPKEKTTLQKLLSLYHPDKNGSEEAKARLQVIMKAYKVLMDDGKDSEGNWKLKEKFDYYLVSSLACFSVHFNSA